MEQSQGTQAQSRSLRVLHLRLPEHLLTDRLSCRLLGPRHDVRVRREREAGVRVAQRLRHGAQRHAMGEQQARVQVPEVVRAQALRSVNGAGTWLVDAGAS